jgi:shikimate dehydrogenase
MQRKIDRLFGLIGYPLGHSFSAAYFAEKFAKEGITDADYRLFPIEQIDQLPMLLEAHPNLVGLNVTVPHKRVVLTYLSELTEAASAIGAVNCVRRQPHGGWIGTNTDAIGFELSLLEFLPLSQLQQMPALVLGNGGSSAAVQYVLRKHGVAYFVASRFETPNTISYAAANELLEKKEPLLIVQTTPVGMAPNIYAMPPILPDLFAPVHFVYDLIYNPVQSLLLQHAMERGATTTNGLSMLHLQAEHAWQFWNEPA